MNSVGILLETIRERRVRAGYRETLVPRERIPPDYVERWARYPTASLVCFLAILGGAVGTVALIMLLVAAMFSPPPGGKATLGPGASPPAKSRP